MPGCRIGGGSASPPSVTITSTRPGSTAGATLASPCRTPKPRGSTRGEGSPFGHRGRMASDPSAVTGGSPAGGRCVLCHRQICEGSARGSAAAVVDDDRTTCRRRKIFFGKLRVRPNRSIELSRSSTASPPDGTFPPQALPRRRGLPRGSRPEHFSRQISFARARSGIYGDEFNVEATVIDSPNCTILVTGASVATRFLPCWRDSS
jgi:hypothetical protein